MTSTEAAILERAARLVVFRTADLVRALNLSQPVISRTLAGLRRHSALTRITRGLWADTRHPKFSPYRVVPFLVGEDSESVTGYVTGYISGISAMGLHGMISQIPASIHVATRKQRRAVKTPVGEFRFHQIDTSIFDGFQPGDAHAHFHVATPIKALFDTLYLSVRRGRRWRYLPELDLPETVTDKAMQYWIERLPTARLMVAVDKRWQDVWQKALGDDTIAVSKQFAGN